MAIAKGIGIEDEALLERTLKIVEEGERDGLVLRVLGALAIRMHIHEGEFTLLFERLGRLGHGSKRFSDIDFVAYSKQRSGVRRLFEDRFGYKVDIHMLMFHGRKRLLYYEPNNLYHIDVFFDNLEFSHDLTFGSDPKTGILSLDSPTIPLADLVLEKLQIHEINEKDIKDLIVLLRSHEIGEKDDREVVNFKYIAKVLSDDWGFWFDAKINLEKVKNFAKKYREGELLSEQDLIDVANKVNKMVEVIEKEPKTKNWMKRAKDGTKKTWWRHVEEIER